MLSVTINKRPFESFMCLDLKVLRLPNRSTLLWNAAIHPSKIHLPFVEINTKEEELKYLIFFF